MRQRSHLLGHRLSDLRVCAGALRGQEYLMVLLAQENYVLLLPVVSMQHTPD